MSYKETLNKGLKREFEFTIESSILNKGIEDKVSELRKTIKMDGFRPGKVPNNIIIQKPVSYTHLTLPTIELV